MGHCLYIIYISYYMKLLELFSGTHSVGNVAKELGWDVVSLDLQGQILNITFNGKSL